MILSRDAYRDDGDSTPCMPRNDAIWGRDDDPFNSMVNHE